MISPSERPAGCLGSAAVAVVAVVVCLTLAGGAVGGATVDDADGEQALDSVQASSHTGLTVDPSTVEFGTVPPGESRSETVTVANTATQSVEVGSVEFTGDTEAFTLQRSGSLEQVQQFDEPVPVPPGVSQQATVRFQPDSPGEYSATLTVRGPNGDELVSATATGSAQAGDISASPESLTFEGTTVGATATRTVTVSNDGNAPLSVSSSIAGSDSYAVREGSTLDIAPGESDRVTVGFSPDSTASQTALLELRSGDPDQPVLPIALSNTDTETAVSARQQGNDRRVNISVRNVRAGQQVDVPVPSSTDENDSVDIDQISVTPSTDADLSLNVTDSEDPLSSTPDLRTGDNATGLRYLNVTHSLPNDQISEVQYTFRMRKDRVADITADPNGTAGSNPDAITMYRYDELTGWSEQNTTRIRTTATHHVYVTTGDGFSEWTTAAKYPDIRVANASANLDAALVNETVQINVELTNDGGADGVFLTELYVNGSLVEDRRVTVPDGGTVPVAFERPFQAPGNYRVTVNNVSVDTIRVNEAGVQQVTTTQNGSGAGGGSGSDDTSDESDDGFASLPLVLGGGAVVLVVVLGGLFYIRSGSEGAANPPPADGSGTDDVIQTEGFGDEGTAVAGTGPPGPGPGGQQSQQPPGGGPPGNQQGGPHGGQQNRGPHGDHPDGQQDQQPPSGGQPGGTRPGGGQPSEGAPGGSGDVGQSGNASQQDDTERSDDS